MTKAQENITYKRASRSALSQQVSTRLQETDTTARQKLIINHIKDPQKEHHIGVVSKTIWLESLNMFDGAKLTLIYVVDQDK